MERRLKVLFIYDMEEELIPFWKDGLWAALNILEKDFDIFRVNVQTAKNVKIPESGIDFILAWGAFNSLPERTLCELPGKRGLCLAGYSQPSPGFNRTYDTVFYETEWSMKWLEEGPIKVLPGETKYHHAFGVNTNIFKPDEAIKYGENIPVFDYLSVGSFSYWKHHENLIKKNGVKMVVGQIQKNNLSESLDIIGNLVVNGVGVMDMVKPERLQALYNMAGIVYVGADEMGGGERSLLEARACGIPVEIELGNGKLFELLGSPVWDEQYYAYQLKKGILTGINGE